MQKFARYVRLCSQEVSAGRKVFVVKPKWNWERQPAHACVMCTRVSGSYIWRTVLHANYHQQQSTVRKEYSAPQVVGTFMYQVANKKEVRLRRIRHHMRVQHI